REAMAIGKAIHKIDAPIAIRRKHAITLNADWQHDELKHEKLEKNEAGYRQNESPDRRPLGVSPDQRDSQPARGSGGGRGCWFHSVHLNRETAISFSGLHD